MPTNHERPISYRVRVARTNLAGTRRRVIVAVADPASAIAFTSASAEVAASLGALAAFSLSLGGLGMVIRQANAEAPAVTPKTFSAAATPAPVEAATNPGAVATSVTSTAVVVQEEEKEVAIMASESDFSGAAAAASEARNWIQSWRDRSVTAAAAASEAVLAVASSEEEVEPPVTISASSFPAATTTITTSSRITEPTLPQLFSVSAAAELAEMAADAPVGITSPAATPLVKQQQQKEEEHVMVAAGIPAAAPTTDLAIDRENQYKAKLARIYTDSKEEYQRSHTAVQAAAAAAKGMKKGVVVIAEEYDHKVQAMWSAFATKKQQEAQLVAKQEKILMDLSELDRVQKKAKLNEGVQKKMMSVGAQIAAFFKQMFAMMMQVMTLVARIMGNSSGNGPKPSAA